jgi:hypothetical protein
MNKFKFILIIAVRSCLKFFKPSLNMCVYFLEMSVHKTNLSDILNVIIGQKEKKIEFRK